MSSTLKSIEEKIKALELERIENEKVAKSLENEATQFLKFLVDLNDKLYKAGMRIGKQDVAKMISERLREGFFKGRKVEIKSQIPTQSFAVEELKCHLMCLPSSYL